MSRFYHLDRRSAAAACGVLAAGLLACSPPEAPEPAPTEAELVRGRYLVHRVTLCYTCHSQRDWSLYSGPPVIGSEGRGGRVGVFGSDAYAPDISPEALSGWSIAELAGSLRSRTLPSGQGFHGEMMLGNLAALTLADARAIAAYVKQGPSAAGVEAEPIGASGTPEDPAAAPIPGGGSVERGEYLVTIARCAACHGPDLSGGVEMEIPEGASLPSANLTPDVATGIGRMTRAEFVDYFKSLDSPDFARLPVPPGQLNTTMPWPWMAAMTRDDLGAIYDYLGTLTPVSKQVGSPAESTAP